MEKLWSFFERDPGFIEIEIISFTSHLLFELLFMCRHKDVVSLVISHFVLLKVFFIVHCFTNSLFKMKSIYKS